MSALDTFPRLLLDHATRRGTSPAMREKDFGIWQTYKWRQVADEVRALACGLAALGFARGEHLAIIGDNRPRLYWATAAAQCLGGIPVPLYQDAPADEMGFVLQDAEVRFAVVEDQEQVDKLLELRERLPALKLLIYDDGRGLRHYPTDVLGAYDDIQRQGRAFDAEHPGFFEEAVAEGKATDIAIMLYTSGTTGRPKGVMLTHDNLIRTGRGGNEREHLTANEEVLAYLPMAWVGDNLFSYTQGQIAGFCMSCPESSDTVLTDMREIGPTYFFAPPRVYENLLTQVSIRMQDAGRFKRWLYSTFMNVARRVGTKLLDKQRVPLADRILYGLGDLLIYAPLRNVLGLSRIRVAYTAGEAIGPDLFRFYRSLGINLKQLYGSTETSVFVCIQPDGEVKSDTVGTCAKDVEIRISEQGEVLVRSPGVFHSYYKNPEATREAKTPEGWFHTGDAGYFDGDGHLKIIDRARDVGRLQDGTLFAPKYLENKLKFFPWIKEAVAFGDGRPYAVALINIDLQAVGNWAERRGLAYSGYTDLAGRDEVQGLVLECVEAVNRDLSVDSKLHGSQIRRFLVLHKELDADDGELTRTRKVRRGFIAERYAALVDALYSNVGSLSVEANVKFEDGRLGTIRAEVKIREASVSKPLAPLRAA
ncbi:MAG: AMP-dependent synthetase/ligase [Myxococcaceae bacterium]